MSINIGSYHAEGPFGNENNLQARSGVYVILGRHSTASTWNVVDVGKSQNIRERVSNHNRAPCWRGQGTRSCLSPRSMPTHTTGC